MLSVLIAESSDALRNELNLELRKKYTVYTAKNGEAAMKLLRTQKIDILLLSLSLHGCDGLFFLEEAGDARPPIILCLATVITEYIAQAAKALGVGYIILKPCPLRAVTSRIDDMVRRQQDEPVTDPEQTIAHHLERLNFLSSWDGYFLLRVGIPLFAQDTTQKMVLDLYPEIAKRCDWSNGIAVERAIRMAIEKAWARRDETVWQEYFPGFTDNPPNKVFIARLAQFL